MQLMLVVLNTQLVQFNASHTRRENFRFYLLTYNKCTIYRDFEYLNTISMFKRTRILNEETLYQGTKEPRYGLSQVSKSSEESFNCKGWMTIVTSGKNVRCDGFLRHCLRHNLLLSTHHPRLTHLSQVFQLYHLQEGCGSFPIFAPLALVGRRRLQPWWRMGARSRRSRRRSRRPPTGGQCQLPSHIPGDIVGIG